MQYITNYKLLIKLNNSPDSCERKVQNRTVVAFRMKFPVFIGLHLSHNIYFTLKTAYTVVVLVWFAFSLTWFESDVNLKRKL